jgi:hypothetical protein
VNGGLKRALAGAAATCAVGALGVACDEVYADPITTPFGAVTVDAGIFSTPRTPPLPCPRTPRENGPCARTGTVCEYGESPDPVCNLHLVCAADSFGRAWVEQSPGACPARCPDAASIVEGAPCDLGDAGTGDDAEELQCATPLGTCACTTGPGGGRVHPRRWVCVPPSPDCPLRRPTLGQTCIGDRSCDYGACAFKRGVRMVCEDEVWQVEAARCE